MSMKKRMTAIMAAMVLVLTLVPASVTKAMGTAYVGTDGVLTAQVSETEGLGILPGCITVSEAEDNSSAVTALSSKVSYDVTSKTMTIDNVSASDLSIWLEGITVVIQGECQFQTMCADRSFTLKMGNGAKLTCTKGVYDIGSLSEEEKSATPPEYLPGTITLDSSVKQTKNSDGSIVYTSAQNESSSDSGSSSTDSSDKKDTSNAGNDSTSGSTSGNSSSTVSGSVTVGSGATKATYALSGSKAVYKASKVSKSKGKKISVPNTIKVDGKTYKVTEIASGALKNYKKLTSVTIGKNVAKIGASAFSGCKKLKKLTINSTKLTKAGVKKAFKGSYIKTVKVPKAKKSAYKKFITKKVTKSKYALKVK